MNDCHSIPISGAEKSERLGSERDLGEQNDNAPPVIQHSVDKLHHNAGLSASRDSVKQSRARLARVKQSVKSIQRRALLCVQVYLL